MTVSKCRLGLWRGRGEGELEGYGSPGDAERRGTRRACDVTAEGGVGMCGGNRQRIAVIEAAYIRVMTVSFQCIGNNFNVENLLINCKSSENKLGA